MFYIRKHTKFQLPCFSKYSTILHETSSFVWGNLIFRNERKIRFELFHETLSNVMKYFIKKILQIELPCSALCSPKHANRVTLFCETCKLHYLVLQNMLLFFGQEFLAKAVSASAIAVSGRQPQLGILSKTFSISLEI